MAVYKRKDGKSWRAVVRIKGYPAVCDHFDRKPEAEDWVRDTHNKIKLGRYKFDQHKKIHTFTQLLEQYIANGALEHHRSADDTRHHLSYWQSRFGSYDLIYITPEFVAKERLLLSNTPSTSGKKRTNSTVNRYTASLSAIFTYAVKLRWINESPCIHLQKLKENPGRDRILSEAEIERLLDACRKSRSTYLYCIVLISFTTGARQGEILNLEWRDIDFDNHLAFLKQTKNGRPRSISLADPVIDELKRLYELRHPLKPLVFASKTAFGRIDIKKAWQTALRIAGITNCRAHDMRHTFATFAAAQGASNVELATAMGHRTLQMLQRYTHLDVQVTKRFSKGISNRILQTEKNETFIEEKKLCR
jgi:integrase